MSFRFIGATCLDNPVLLEQQPMYLSNLLNKSVLEVERLYHGNWFVRQEGAGFWKHEWCKIIKTFPHPDDPDDQIVERVRCWDLPARCGPLPISQPVLCCPLWTPARLPSIVGSTFSDACKGFLDGMWPMGRSRSWAWSHNMRLSCYS